jgi:4-aminobutyrate aminotransferase-like enzyme
MALGVQNPSMVDSRTRSEVEAEVIADYRASSPRSAALHEAARRVMPGGDTRTVAFHAPYPLVITQGRGCRVQDADGRTYVDLLNNYTSLIHGHAHPAVVAAVPRFRPRMRPRPGWRRSSSTALLRSTWCGFATPVPRRS